jgi:hypothetical protein
MSTSKPNVKAEVKHVVLLMYGNGARCYIKKKPVSVPWLLLRRPAAAQGA